MYGAIFLVLVEGGGAVGTKWVDAREAAKPPARQRTAAPTKLSGPNVSRAEVEAYVFQA